MTLAIVSALTQEELTIGMQLTDSRLLRAETASAFNDVRCLEFAALPWEHLGVPGNSDKGPNSSASWSLTSAAANGCSSG